MPTMTDRSPKHRAKITALDAAIRGAGYRQGYFDGGPPFEPSGPFDVLALGATRRGSARLAYYENEACDRFVVFDRVSLVWHVKNDAQAVLARGVGAAQFVRAARAARVAR